jgi:putative acetyltransferase
MGTPNIRPAKATDIPRLIEIIQTTIESYDYIFELEVELPDFLDFDAFYRPGNAELYVIETDAGIIGCGALKLDKELPYLSRIYVCANHRGKGWGKLIVQFLMQRNQQLGYKAVELWSDTKFRTAHAMYEKLGFRFTGRVRPLWDINHCFEYHYTSGA